jgi:hypothetical protein
MIVSHNPPVLRLRIQLTLLLEEVKEEDDDDDDDECPFVPCVPAPARVSPAMTTTIPQGISIHLLKVPLPALCC